MAQPSTLSRRAMLQQKWFWRLRNKVLSKFSPKSQSNDLHNQKKLRAAWRS